MNPTVPSVRFKPVSLRFSLFFFDRKQRIFPITAATDIALIWWDHQHPTLEPATAASTVCDTKDSKLYDNRNIEQYRYSFNNCPAARTPHPHKQPWFGSHEPGRQVIRLRDSYRLCESQSQTITVVTILFFRDSV